MPCRTVTLAFLAATALCADVSASHAQSYPWCAIYGGARAGAQNCGFNTFAQCQATVSGIGGFCQRNPLYEPPRKKRSG